jgi:hypothetical protein
MFFSVAQDETAGSMRQVFLEECKNAMDNVTMNFNSDFPAEKRPYEIVIH